MQARGEKERGEEGREGLKLYFTLSVREQDRDLYPYGINIKYLGTNKKSLKWQPTPVFLPGESHGQRSLVGYSPQGRKELNMTEVT